MIYVFISQNIRLPSSTQFQNFKIIKHMKYTYSSKIIHTSSNSSLQLSFTTFWENILSLKFHHTILRSNKRGINCIPLNCRILSILLVTSSSESRLGSEKYWVTSGSREITRPVEIILSGSSDDEKIMTKLIIRPYWNLQVLFTNGSKIFLTSLRTR